MDSTNEEWQFDYSQEQEIFLLSQTFRPAVGPTQSSMDNGNSLPGGKAAEGEDDRSFRGLSACTPPSPCVPSGRTEGHPYRIVYHVHN